MLSSVSMVVEGLAIAAAIAGILSGVASCAKFAADIKEKRKAKKVGDEINQADALGRSLRDYHSGLDGSYALLSTTGSVDSLGNRLAFLKDSELIDRQYVGSQTAMTESAQSALWSAWSILASLESQLQLLAVQHNSMSTIDFSRFQTMADRSQSIALDSLRQLSQGNAASSSTISLVAGSTVSAQSGLSGRARLNAHNICKTALLYRINNCKFEDVTVLVTGGRNPEWECKLCHMRIFQVTIMLSSNSADNIWIAPSGMLKAHCTLEAGHSAGWTCIWQKVSRDCYLRFDSRRSLLKHMQTCHLGTITSGQDITIDWPADSRNWTAKTCGYGATIGSKRMQNGERSFIVRGS